MLNYVWLFLLAGSLIYSFFTNTSSKVCDEIFKSGENAISFMLKTGAIMVMWSGFMNVAQRSALTDKISRLLSPFIVRVFGGVRKNSVEEKLISSNLSANMLGLSNAATPLGMKAMKKLSEKSKDGTATDDMCMLCIINCASIQLIPSTLIAIRASYGSKSPGDIIIPIWIASFLTLIFAVSVAKLWERRGK